jgi:hypothetical protein
MGGESPDEVLDSTGAGLANAVREPRHTPVALDCASRNDMMLPKLGLHIVEFAEANSRFSMLIGSRGQ